MTDLIDFMLKDSRDHKVDINGSMAYLLSRGTGRGALERFGRVVDLVRANDGNGYIIAACTVSDAGFGPLTDTLLIEFDGSAADR